MSIQKVSDVDPRGTLTWLVQDLECIRRDINAMSRPAAYPDGGSEESWGIGFALVCTGEEKLCISSKLINILFEYEKIT